VNVSTKGSPFPFYVMTVRKLFREAELILVYKFYCGIREFLAPCFATPRGKLELKFKNEGYVENFENHPRSLNSSRHILPNPF
jgi:hypothetical protein